MEPSQFVPRIATIEIPVSNLKSAYAWYQKIFGLEALYEFQDRANEVMLQFHNHPVDGATIYLVQTSSPERLGFFNSNHGYTQSIIDFYVQDLAAFHRHLKSFGVVTNRETLELKPGEISGFGFFDPDGNSLGATNAVFIGEEMP